jgi:chromosome segregation ATPase
MPADFDASEFIDGDFQFQKTAYSGFATVPTQPQRAPMREEENSRAVAIQQELADLKRRQEEKEREKAAVEERLRRRTELQTGRQEMLQNLTRGIGLLEKAEFTARQDAEQMAKSLTDFRDALGKVETIREEAWTAENSDVELTRALTAVENARMEWNSARLKFTLLSGKSAEGETTAPSSNPFAPSALSGIGFGQLCRMGLALTWPLAIVGLAALGVFLTVLLRR